MLKNHPPHKHRLRFVLKRIKKGKTDDEIISEMNTLKWIDFNKRITSHHIKYIRRNEK